MVAPEPFFRPRGTPFSVLHRIRAVLAAGHTVDLVTYPFGEDVPMPGLRYLRCPRPWLVDDVPIGPSVAKLLLDGPLYWTTRRALRAQRYDVLHTHEEASFFGVDLARRHGLLHVYDMHSSLPNLLANYPTFNRLAFRTLFHALERRVLRSCDGVITISDRLGEIASRECGSTPHVTIENAGDDAAIFSADDADLPWDVPPGRRVLLYTGTFEAYQGLDLLLEAFSTLAPARPTLQLVLVGGRAGQVQRLRARALAAGLGDRVTLVGTVHPRHIAGFLARAELIVSPRSEGSYAPLKLYGYLRSGRALVATDVPAHRQVLDSEVAHLVAPSVPDLAQGMATLLDQPKLATALAERALRRARERYSDEAYLRRVGSFYQLVLGSPPAAHRGAPRPRPWPSTPQSPGDVADRQEAFANGVRRHRARPLSG